jgi:hypothetical protein
MYWSPPEDHIIHQNVMDKFTAEPEHQDDFDDVPRRSSETLLTHRRRQPPTVKLHASG